jgi:hypothetical protein
MLLPPSWGLMPLTGLTLLMGLTLIPALSWIIGESDLLGPLPIGEGLLLASPCCKCMLCICIWRYVIAAWNWGWISSGLPISQSLLIARWFRAGSGCAFMFIVIIGMPISGNWTGCLFIFYRLGCLSLYIDGLFCISLCLYIECLYLYIEG